MNIHLITYLTSKLFWIYTVFRYNTILYPKNEDTQKLFAYFCAYLLSCWGSMQWGTMYGDLIFELIALLIITVAYQADWQHHVWNTLMVYIMGILCDGIPIVFFQRYAVARNPVHHHMGPGTIVMGNFIFFLLEVIIERKVGVKRSYYIKNRHWLAMLSVPVISIIVCIRILLPDRRGVRSTIVLFLLFINVFIFYLHDEVQKSYIETAKQEEMKIQMSQYAKELEMMMKSQDRLNKIHHDYKHHLTTIGAMAKTGGNEGLIVTSNYFVAENGVTRRSRRFSVFIGCLRDDRLGNNGNIYIVHEVEENLHFLLALAAGFVRGIDDDFLDILVHDGLCQLLHIHIFLCQGDKGIQTVVHFFPLFHPFFDNFNFEL